MIQIGIIHKVWSHFQAKNKQLHRDKVAEIKQVKNTCGKERERGHSEYTGMLFTTNNKLLSIVVKLKKKFVHGQIIFHSVDCLITK